MIRLLSLLATALVLSASLQAQELHPTKVGSGFLRPTWIGSPPGDTERLFVMEYRRIRIIKNGVTLDEPFMDVTHPDAAGDELDLWSMTFDPDFQNNGRLILVYDDSMGDSVVAQYTVDPQNPDRIDYSSVQTVFGPLFQSDLLHNLCDVKFGPDGMLYVGAGDGGPIYDPNDEGQSPDTPYGTIMRFDLDLPHPHIPADNPFVGDPTGYDAVWHYGIRNPWRMAFDAVTGDFYFADVGQDWVEELNVIAAGEPAGKNFGWRCMEGFTCAFGGGCTCGDPQLTLPELQYLHQNGRCAIIGGEVYRGNRLPGWNGWYFYAEHCTGEFWALDWDPTGANTTLIEITDQLIPDVGALSSITTFGVDAEGEIYFCMINGDLFRIDAEIAAPRDLCAGAGGNGMGCGGCPCGNDAPGTLGGCLNSEGRSARLNTWGFAEMSSDSMRFGLTGGTSNTFAVLLSGSVSLPQSGPCPPGVGLGGGFLDGKRCVGGSVLRHGARMMDSEGAVGPISSHWGPGILTHPAFSAGQTRYFQAFYRDNPSTSCMTGQNTTNAISRVFQP